MERDAALSRRQIVDWACVAGFGDLVAAVDGCAVGSGASNGGKRDDSESHREGVQFRKSQHRLCRASRRTAARRE